ncbi:MAG: hypothetical protein SFU86_05080 [Pirellulaceae bacterium]|nr:hypothetical protein [Pirellulaceae bacterium]
MRLASEQAMRAALWLVALALPCTGMAATRVDLVIDEPFADRKVPWPLTTGVPFPRGALKSAQHCRLVDDTGAEQPLQAKIAATWDAERTSIRWLTIDFIAQPGRKYALEFGPEIKRTDSPTLPLVAGGEPQRVATGAMEVEFYQARAQGMGAIRVDLDQDGKVEPDEVVATGAADGEHYYLDQNGQRFASHRDGADRRIVVESSGPVRACVRVDGFYTGPKGERIAKYRTRYHFFAGLPVVKVIDELGFIGSTKETRFKDIGFALDLKQATKGRVVTVDSSGRPGNQPHSVNWGPETGAIRAAQTTYRHYGNLECEALIAEHVGDKSLVIEQGDKLGEWMQVRDGQSAVTGSLRWLWQQFPKEWAATPNRLTLHLWSPQAGELDFGAAGIERFLGAGGAKYLRGGQDQHQRNPLENFFYHADVAAIARGAADGLGINKHHEFWLHFGPAADHERADDYARLAALQPLALASGEWNCSTDVFGPLAARPNDSPDEAAVDKLFDLSRQVQDEFGDYGWWLFGAGPHYSYHWDPATKLHYADSRRFEFHTYGKETQLWWNYLRSGERKFHDWAIPAENHWVDIAVSHMPTKIECGWRGGDPDPRTLHWRPGEWAIDSPTHYVRHHDRAEAWLRGGAQFWASYHRTLETTTLAYYLTGDERYSDVLGYWRDYWGALAGKTSASPDTQPWHREQAWYKPTPPGEPAKTWAQMIRDYAPFYSGTRHNLTLFFNLATLYEHSWDPQIGLATREYADAFLDPAHPIGTWRPQESSLPSHAEAPSMGHFWVPALWKYARATGDPRMKQILPRYFDAGYAADPLRDYEDVGVYSNAYVGYAYYFTRDPKFLPLARHELDLIGEYAQPLADPQEINGRLYNPYAPARTFAGAPRLIWALQEARRNGVAMPKQPLRQQRTAIALHKQAGQELTARLWGFDRELTIIGPDGQRVVDFQVATEQFASEIQPFDRIQENYEVYLHRLTLPAGLPVGAYQLSPRLELAMLDWNTASAPLWNAAQPVQLKGKDAVYLPVSAEPQTLVVESAVAAQLRLRDVSGTEQTGKISGNRAEFALAGGRAGNVRLRIEGAGGWLRLADRDPDQCWVSPVDRPLSPEAIPSKLATAAALRTSPPFDLEPTFIAGRFGQGVQVVPGRALHLPMLVENEKSPLLDPVQGTIEFWVQKRWDDRLIALKQPSLLAGGKQTVPVRPTLPWGEWVHVALVWAPYRGDPEQTVTYTYVNGRDPQFYRSFNWAGYSSPRSSAGNKAPPLAELIAKAVPGAAYAIDELRISKTARYADLTVEFGPQQTFNPIRFQPPTEPFEADAQTTLLLHFDGSLQAAAPQATYSARQVK